MLQSIAAKLIGRFVRDQRGATMVEYGLLVALVAVAVIAAVTTLVVVSIPFSKVQMTDSTEYSFS